MWNYEKFLVDAGRTGEALRLGFRLEAISADIQALLGRRRGSCTNGGKGDDGEDDPHDGWDVDVGDGPRRRHRGRLAPRDSDFEDTALGDGDAPNTMGVARWWSGSTETRGLDASERSAGHAKGWMRHPEKKNQPD